MTVRADVEACDWKVDYWTTDGYQHTAYLDNITHDHLMAFGTHKHTDKPVVLTRDAVGDRWRESAGD